MISIGIGAFIIGYLLGSIPFAVIISRFYGVDIFKVGSGNAGATNVKRTIGKTAGNLCFFLDLLKGLLSAGWVQLIPSNTGALFTLSTVGLVAAIIGHRFSVFLKFQGGKGVATTMGGLIIIMPISLLIGISIWGLVFFLSRHVFLASLLFALSLPFSTFFLNKPDVYTILALGLTLFLIFSHWSNISRFLKGKETHFGKKD